MNNYSNKAVLDNCAYNLKALIKHEEMSQKDFSKLMDVTEATISNYTNGKLPGTDFLLRLKYKFPYINIEDFLYQKLTFEGKERSGDSQKITKVQSDMYKYYGLYNLYYLDTTAAGSARDNHVYLNAAPDLKKGLLYIYKDPNNGSGRCIAIVNSSDSDQITQFRKQITDIAKYQYNQALQDLEEGEAAPDRETFLYSAETAKRFSAMLQSSEKTAYKTYNGKIRMTQNHMYIQLKQIIDFEEQISIVLHRKYFRKSHYVGGLGTMNTVSNGHPAEPCIQMIGVSHNNLNVFDSIIKKRLRFCSPIIDDHSLKEQNEEKKLLRLAEDLYRPPVEGERPRPMYYLDPEDKKIIFRSKLNYMLTSNIERNLLYYTRVSLEDDHNWYLLITGLLKDDGLEEEG